MEGWRENVEWAQLDLVVASGHTGKRAPQCREAAVHKPKGVLWPAKVACDFWGCENLCLYLAHILLKKKKSLFIVYICRT